MRQNKKPTGQLLLAVGLVSCQNLCFSAHQAPSPEDTLIRVDVPVLIDVIRLALAFWEIEVIGYCCLTKLVVLLPAQFWLGTLRVKFLEELHQPVD